MTETSKLTLSSGEMQLVTNTEWILTKRIIIGKVNLFFGAVAVAMQDIVEAEREYLPAAAIMSAPKIAKGENYGQLPYVLLDYPRCFEKENIFAIRTMFWWGNFFSCTLHLSGSYKTMFKQALIKNSTALQQNNLYLCISNNEWEHHFEPDNYVAANTIDIGEINKILSQQHFIKVAAKFSLHQWHEMDVLLQKSFSDVLHLLKY
ncbi:hypothetical protein [Ferruginibacter sp. SUN106]|uniref:hypothetical protein n=1 Tax=Ferruginibacter sp. SUN106 TaxID=2978348 RepID=UPI003D36B52A